MRTVIRPATGADHARVDAVIDGWWSGRAMRRMLPRLFFEHFGNSSLIVEGVDAELVGFLIGFVSTGRPGEAYIHFVGVRPEHRGSGIARDLYLRFFELAATRGCRTVGCVTAPVNAGSIAFHRAMGFQLVGGDVVVDGVPIHVAYDGPGEDRVVFQRAIP